MNIARWTILIVILACGACERAATTSSSPSAPPPPPEPPPPPPLVASAAGEAFTVVQRQRVRFPPDDPRVVISIGDITRGQTLLRVLDEKGKVMIDDASVREGDTRSFDFDGRQYAIRVEDFANRLTGDDTARLRLLLESSPEPATKAAAERPATSDKERIEAALRQIESSGLVFIRNGQEHSGADAAAHIRRKLEAAGDKVKTYDDFVEGVASKSSSSGKDYLVRLPDGSTVTAREWLRNQAK